jgi:Zn-dependent peptidase ImmA (M78 family)/transcriptional regulator with XRE-family HTH domain
MNGIGQAIEMARRAAGLTQDELAEKAGLRQGSVSRYEKGLREPDAHALAQMAAAVGVTVDLLMHAGRLHGAMAVDAHMRRRATAPAPIWRRLEARLNMHRVHASRLFEEVSLRTEQRIPRFDPVDVPPDDAARLVRMQWRMPVGPVQSMTNWLEAAGCLVIEEDFGSPRVDGLSQWIGDYPVILINVHAPTDRKRLTMGHELGHLCLHSDEVTPELEREADQFAAEFLTPMDQIRPQLRGLTIGRLHDLKRSWGVSMQALIERAYEARTMTSQQRTAMYKTFSTKGWRKREPVSDELRPEHPDLVCEIGAALQDRGLTPDEIAHLAGFSDADHNTIFRVPGRTLHAV